MARKAKRSRGTNKVRKAGRAAAKKRAKTISARAKSKARPKSTPRSKANTRSKSKARPKTKPRAKRAGRQTARSAPARKAPRRSGPRRGQSDYEVASPLETRGLGPEAAGQSGDTEGLSRAELADSESVEELLEEGQAFEAGVIEGVENAPEADEGEVQTREVPEDDVPEEYRDRDREG